MAVAPGPDDLLALAAAEAFVRAYFAGDGAFGDALSDSSGDEAAISYVEWARAFSLEPTSDGYSVAVALQLVVGPLGGPYVRRPLDSVVVELATLDGAPAPVGIPKVAGNGLLGDHVPLEELVPAADVPPGSAAKAVAALGRWGEATVVGGVESATGWAVAVDVKGTSGGRWLLMVETPAEGG